MLLVTMFGVAPAGAVPNVTATPTVGVLDGNVITLSGFATLEQPAVAIGQCAVGVDLTTLGSAGYSCTWPIVVAPEASSKAFTWRRQLVTPYGASFDCAVVECAMVVVGGEVIDLTAPLDVIIATPILASAVIPIEMGGGDFDFAVAADPTTDLIHGDLISVEASGLSEFATAEVVQCVAAVTLSSLDLCLRTPVPIAADGTVSTTVTARRSYGGISVCTAASSPCRIGILATTGASAQRLRLLPLTFSNYYDVAPSPSGLEHGDELMVDTEGRLPVVDGAVAFTMQCAFVYGGVWDMRCSHATEATPADAGSHHSTIDVRRTFPSGDETIECDVNAACLLVTLSVQSEPFQVLAGAGVPIHFAPVT
ncbi:MAG: neocarzinostatin apoprotein domain-containing protein [Acidimicrobiales bacterium]